MTNIIRKDLIPTLLKTDAKERTIRHLISTERPDRDGDIIDAEGWDFGEFQKNPVVLFAHRADIPPIGRATELRKTPRGIEAKTQFPPYGVCEFADKIFELNRLGYLRSWSVGFIPKRWEPRRDDAGRIRGNIYREQVLVEYSSVPVPSNAEAVNLIFNSKSIQEMKKLFFEEDETLENLFYQLLKIRLRNLRLFAPKSHRGRRACLRERFGRQAEIAESRADSAKKRGSGEFSGGNK